MLKHCNRYAAFRKYNFAAFQKAKLPFLSSLSGLTSSQVDHQSGGVEGNSTGGTVTPCLKYNDLFYNICTGKHSMKYQAQMIFSSDFEQMVVCGLSMI